MLPADRIRHTLLYVRNKPEGSARDAEIVALMTDALVEERRNTGAATADALKSRYGFTKEELDRLQVRALNEATRTFVDHGMVDPVSVAA